MAWGGLGGWTPVRRGSAAQHCERDGGWSRPPQRPPAPSHCTSTPTSVGSWQTGGEGREGEGREPLHRDLPPCPAYHRSHHYGGKGVEERHPHHGTTCPPTSALSMGGMGDGGWRMGDGYTHPLPPAPRGMRGSRCGDASSAPSGSDYRNARPQT